LVAEYDLENVVKACTNCNLVQNNSPKLEPSQWSQTSKLFDRVHIDYAGSFLGHYFFVLIDAYSKWPDFITKDMTSKIIIKKYRYIFSTFGIPKNLESDNGRPFISYEFTTFLKINGVKHQTTMPFHPATNGLAERFVQTLKVALKKKIQNGNSTVLELNQILCNFLLT